MHTDTNAVVVYPRDGKLGQPFVVYAWISSEGMANMTFPVKQIFEDRLRKLGTRRGEAYSKRTHKTLTVFLHPHFTREGALSAATKLQNELKKIPELKLKPSIRAHRAKDIQLYLDTIH